MLWALLVGSAHAGCRLLVDGEPAESLDCEAIGAWVLSCDLPEASGKVRVQATIDAYDLHTEARVPLGDQQHFQVALTGASLRSGSFEAIKATHDLLVGQPVNHTAWCPLVQPGGIPGQRSRLPIQVVVSSHKQTGFAEQTMDGGVVQRVPTYDQGTPLVTMSIPTLQKQVGEQPPDDVLRPALDKPVHGQLQLSDGQGAWRTVVWSGSRFDLNAAAGGAAANLHLLVLDFPTADVEAVAGGDAVTWIEADLQKWLAEDPTSLMGRAGFAKSELVLPFPVTWSTKSRTGRSWRVGSADRGEVAIVKAGDRVRVAIAWRMSPLDPAARDAILQAENDGL